MANYQRNLAKEQFWRDALRRHGLSGMNIRQFCLREVLSESFMLGLES